MLFFRFRLQKYYKFAIYASFFCFLQSPDSNLVEKICISQKKSISLHTFLKNTIHINYNPK